MSIATTQSNDLLCFPISIHSIDVPIYAHHLINDFPDKQTNTYLSGQLLGSRLTTTLDGHMDMESLFYTLYKVLQMSGSPHLFHFGLIYVVISMIMLHIAFMSSCLCSCISMNDSPPTPHNHAYPPMSFLLTLTDIAFSAVFSLYTAL